MCGNIIILDDQFSLGTGLSIGSVTSGKRIIIKSQRNKAKNSSSPVRFPKVVDI